MGNDLADIIYRHRLSLGATQDQYGAKYGVSGPAIFKFEKAFVRPSLTLWVSMALDAGLPERRAVLLWLRSKIPEQYRDYVQVKDAGDSDGRKKSKDGTLDYSAFENPEETRRAASEDKKLPKGLRELLQDDELWSLFKPTGHEINMLRDRIAPLGKGSKTAYGDALWLIRVFTHSF